MVNGSQTIAHRDNTARAPADVDEEWFAVVKEQTLARCEKPDPLECLPQCYHNGDQQRPTGWPPAVNASGSLCPNNGLQTGLAAPLERVSVAPRFKNTLGRTFSGNPMNQPKVLVHLTQPQDPNLRGSFNWTFELDARCSFFESNLHSRMLVVPMPARLKRACV